MGDRVSLGAFVTVVSDQGPPTPTGVFFFLAATIPPSVAAAYTLRRQPPP